MKSELPRNEIHYSEDRLGQITQFSNLGQNIIKITEDKVRIILSQHLEELQAIKAWITPISIFLSLLLMQTTVTTFKQTFNIRPEIWEAIFFILTVVTGIWSLISIVNSLYLCFWKKVSLENVIKKLKKQSDNNPVFNKET